RQLALKNPIHRRDIRVLGRTFPRFHRVPSSRLLSHDLWPVEAPETIALRDSSPPLRGSSRSNNLAASGPPLTLRPSVRALLVPAAPVGPSTRERVPVDRQGERIM